MVGDRDDLGLVLDDQHRVALVAQPQQEVVHALDVVRVQAGGRLVEDVRDVRERGAEVADHLDALGLAAGEGAGGPVQAEVAEADLDEGIEQVAEVAEQRGHARVVDPADEGGQVADLHRRAVGDVHPVDAGGQRGGGEPGAAAVRAVGEDHGPVHEGLDVGLHGLAVLGQVRPADLGDQALVGEVVGSDLHLHRGLVQEVGPLLLGEVLELGVGGVEAGVRHDLPVPGVHGEARDRDRALVEGEFAVHELVHVDVGDLADALAARAHAVGRVEAEGRGGADVGGAEAGEDDPQHGVGVGGGAHGGTGVGAHPLLVDHDGGAQVVQTVHVE